MLSKSYVVSFIGSSLAHGVLLFGAGNLHTPARVEIQPAPTAMELILSQGTSGEILRRCFAAPHPPKDGSASVEDDTEKTEDDTGKKNRADTTKTLSVAQPQPLLMRHPPPEDGSVLSADEELRSGSEGSRLKQPEPSASPPADTPKKMQNEAKREINIPPVHAQPIPGYDIGAAQIGSSLKTHGPCIEQNFPPKYPRWARRQGWEGSALLKVSISKGGHAQKVSLEKSSGYTILDEAAVNAVAQWKFYPAKQLGVNVPSELFVPIVFQIKG